MSQGSYFNPTGIKLVIFLLNQFIDSHNFARAHAIRALGSCLFSLSFSTFSFFMALGINQVTHSNRQFCRSVCLSVSLSVGLSVPVLLL